MFNNPSRILSVRKSAMSQVRGVQRIHDSMQKMSTGPGPEKPKYSGDQKGSEGEGGKTKAGLAAVGAATLLGGITYAYKVYSDDKYNPNQPWIWFQDQFGLSPKSDTIQPASVPIVEQKKETVPAPKLGSDTVASCAGKDGCEEKKVDACPKKCGESDCLHKMDKEEELIAKANQDLEKALKDVKPKAMEATEAALKAYCEAAELIKIFMDKAYCAIDEESLESPRFEEVWCDVFDASVKRCAKVKEAIEKGQCAWELLCRLREVIENGKACKYTTCNPLLITAEESLLCAERELLNAKAKMDCVQSESNLVEQYRNLIEDFRRDLKAEKDSLLTLDPTCKANLTPNECTMVLTHAYKKVLRVQKELAIVQGNANQALAGSLNFTGVQKNLDEVKAYYETELRKALARQALVHQDSMELNRELLQREFDRKIQQQKDIVEAEQLLDLRMKYKQATSTLAAMEEALRARKDDDRISELLRKLWSFSATLYYQINFASVEETSRGIRFDKARLLSEFSEDPFAVQLLKTIPDQVESTEQLRSRFFNKLDKECRKLGVFRPEEELSIGKYIMGYLQGAFVSRCDGDKLNPSNIYEILDKTGHYLRRGELLEAVITLNKAEGIPRQLCQDWLADARAVLEASQTLYALMSHVNAQNS